MKKILLIAVVCMMAMLTLAGCGNSANDAVAGRWDSIATQKLQELGQDVPDHYYLLEKNGEIISVIGEKEKEYGTYEMVSENQIKWMASDGNQVIYRIENAIIYNKADEPYLVKQEES